MAIMPITIYGDKILRQTVKPVKAIDDEMIMIIKNMFETMRNANGIGLAGNQVNLDKSVFVIDLTPVEGYEDLPPKVFINPEIIEYSDDTVFFEEGCLSLPNLRAEVERPEAIKIKFLNTGEEEEILEADDFYARVILHEFDHLIGKMIPDRVDEFIRKKLSDELKQIKNRQVEVDYEITQK
ncbi:MAG: peptide deformylase [Ignavibacteriae bacterium]|nr:peptide deformylase [Ignavibacteriota bacterium]NOG99897.1 peptide deformylase [Ignavibacteriota bacterium]